MSFLFLFVFPIFSSQFSLDHNISMRGRQASLKKYPFSLSAIISSFIYFPGHMNVHEQKYIFQLVQMWC